GGEGEGSDSLEQTQAAPRGGRVGTTGRGRAPRAVAARAPTAEPAKRVATGQTAREGEEVARRPARAAGAEQEALAEMPPRERLRRGRYRKRAPLTPRRWRHPSSTMRKGTY